jgi:hypothetical protein
MRRQTPLIPPDERALLGGCYGDHAEVGDPVSRGVFALAVIGKEGLHLAHEVKLTVPVIALTGTNNLQENVDCVLPVRFLTVLEAEER